MDLSGKVIKILPPLSGKSSRTGDTWHKYSFVIETMAQYPKKVCFTVMGEDLWNKMNIQVGSTYSVSFDPESREWDDRWFTDLKAWNAACIDAAK